MFDVRTAGDMAHIDIIFNFLPNARRHCVSIFYTAAMTRPFRSARSRGNGGMNTRSLTYLQRRKPQSAMSGDFGGHSISSWSFPDADLTGTSTHKIIDTPEAKYRFIFRMSRGRMQLHVYNRWHKKTGTFEKPNKNWRNPRKNIYWQNLKHYHLPFKIQ